MAHIYTPDELRRRLESGAARKRIIFYSEAYYAQPSRLNTYDRVIDEWWLGVDPTVPTTIAAERAANPFLRWDDPAVVDSARSYCASHGLPADSDDAIFAAIRHGKDNF